MTKIVVMQDGHISLEYEEKEHEEVKIAISRLDPEFNITRHISCSTIIIRGEELTSTVDEMGCGLISGSNNGDNIIKEINFILSNPR